MARLSDAEKQELLRATSVRSDQAAAYIRPSAIVRIRTSMRRDFGDCMHAMSTTPATSSGSSPRRGLRASLWIQRLWWKLTGACASGMRRARRGAGCRDFTRRCHGAASVLVAAPDIGRATRPGVCETTTVEPPAATFEKAQRRPLAPDARWAPLDFDRTFDRFDSCPRSMNVCAPTSSSR